MGTTTTFRALAAAPALLLAVGAAAAAPGSASAATWCVPAAGEAACAGDHVAATVATAVAAADGAPGPDTVLIGAGLHNLGNGVHVSAADTELAGAGRDATILTVDPLDPDDGFTRQVVSGRMGRLADLTLRLASAELDDGNNGSVEGADVYDGVVERVRIDDEGARFGAGINDGRGSALLLRNGALRDVEVELRGADVEGISLGGWYLGRPYELERVDVRADRALRINPSPLDDVPDPVVRARRVRLSGVEPLSVGSGRVELSDAAIVSTAPPRRWDDDLAAAVRIHDGYNGLGTELLLDRVTVAGVGGAATGQAPHHAFAVAGNGMASAPTRLRARHVIASGFDRTLLHGDWGGAIEATVEHSLLDVREGPGSVAREDEGTNASPATISLTAGNRVGDPLFADRAGGDLRLLTGSPAADVGGEELIAGEATDLGGAPRPADGDGDGLVAADAGAYEHQWVPVGPGPLPRTGEEPPGPGGPVPGGPGPRPSADRVAPVVRGLRWVPARRATAGPVGRRTGGGGAAAAGGARRGAALAGSFRFTLSERAWLTVTIERRAGRRWRRAGTVRAGWRERGRAAIAFRGRIGRRTLAPGAYRARLVAVDAAGNRSAPRTVRLAARR